MLKFVVKLVIFKVFLSISGKAHLREALLLHEEAMRVNRMCRELRKKDVLQDVLRLAHDRSLNKYASIDEEDDFQVSTGLESLSFFRVMLVFCPFDNRKCLILRLLCPHRNISCPWLFLTLDSTKCKTCFPIWAQWLSSLPSITGLLPEMSELKNVSTKDTALVSEAMHQSSSQV